MVASGQHQSTVIAFSSDPIRATSMIQNRIAESVLVKDNAG